MFKLISSILFILISLGTIAQDNLKYYTDIAKQNSPLVQDNMNQSAVNQLEIQRLKAFYTKPQIGVSALYQFSPIISQDNGKTRFETNSNSAENYYGYDLAASNGGQYQALLNLTQPLFNKKKYESASEQIDVASKINENNAKLSAHDIEKIVIDQYILCLQDKRQLTYAIGMTQLLSEQKDIMQKLVEGSVYKQSDLSLMKIEYQNMLSQQATFKVNYQRDLMNLNVLCGINDTTIVELQDLDLKLVNSKENPSFLEKYRLDSLNLIAQQKTFELKYKPQINFFANTGLNAVYAPTIPKRFGVTGGLIFNYNFFDGHQKDINKEKIVAQQKTVDAYRENFLNQNAMRKAQIISELNTYDQRISISQQQLKDYEVLLNSYKQEIMSGQLSILNYITVLKSRAITQRDYTLLYAQQQSLINAYNYWNW
ncbi:MAG: TolC family protein [Crocinitomicaceae bacterium]